MIQIEGFMRTNPQGTYSPISDETDEGQTSTTIFITDERRHFLFSTPIIMIGEIHIPQISPGNW